MVDKRRKRTQRLRCIRCKSFRAIIRSYGLNICRRCFREVANDLNFRKYN
ncbi:MAG: 30S ribosomal protein S14 [Promethearchaeota archaeon]